MFEPTPFSRISNNIVQQIRQAILKGNLHPGDRLPPEKEIAQKFGVSKASLREAYRALEALGLIEVRQGVSGGAFICKVDQDIFQEGLINYIFFQQPTIDEFTKFRLMLEPQLTRKAALNRNRELLTLLQENLHSSRKMVKKGTFSYEIDLEFHKLIAQDAENTFLSLMINSVHNALVAIKRSFKPDIAFCEHVHAAHERIYAAIEGGHGEKAEKAMEDHLLEVGQGLKALVEKQ